MNENVRKLKDSMELRIVGKGDVIDKIIIALLSGGHVLIEDVPGVGKTSLARALRTEGSCPTMLTELRRRFGMI